MSDTPILTACLLVLLAGCGEQPSDKEWAEHIRERESNNVIAAEMRAKEKQIRKMQQETEYFYQRIETAKILTAFWVGACYGRGIINSNEVRKVLGTNCPDFLP